MFKSNTLTPTGALENAPYATLRDYFVKNHYPLAMAARPGERLMILKSVR
jgi:hypothetical protein